MGWWRLGVAAGAAAALIACGGDDGSSIQVSGAGEGERVGVAGMMSIAGTGAGPMAGGAAQSGARVGAQPSAGVGAPSSAAGMNAAGTGAKTAGAAAAMAGAGGMNAAGTNAGGAGGMTPAAGSGATTPGDDAYAQYHDPGKGPWEMGTAEDCKMDTSRIAAGENLAVIRYGKLCHIQGGNTSGQNFSATKTLGGVLAGRAAYLVKDVPRSGPGTGPILHEDKLSDWGVSTSGLNSNALLNHVMSMTAFSPNLEYGALRYSYDTVGTREITRIVDVSMVALKQAPGAPTQAVAFMQQEVFDTLGMEGSSWPGSTIGTGWTGTLEDMARVGVMLVHDGWYGGERFMEASWVYRMGHPAHEDANTGYGQLAWVVNRGGATGPGASANDPCAPPPFWPKYPHVGSEAPDCGAPMCEQEYDVGVFFAAGLGGQYVVMHPGLDMVLVGHNASGAESLWRAVRPALVAMDPKFMGDEAAFCMAYGSGSYAPDLLVPRVAPQ
jgi:hypothetical protein